jgi:hypothetical protein
MHPNENRDLASGRDARYRERKRGGENPFSTSLFAGANRRVGTRGANRRVGRGRRFGLRVASSIIDFGTHLRLVGTAASARDLAERIRWIADVTRWQLGTPDRSRAGARGGDGHHPDGPRGGHPAAASMDLAPADAPRAPPMSLYILHDTTNKAMDKPRFYFFEKELGASENTTW